MNPAVERPAAGRRRTPAAGSPGRPEAASRGLRTVGLSVSPFPPDSVDRTPLERPPPGGGRCRAGRCWLGPGAAGTGSALSPTAAAALEAVRRPAGQPPSRTLAARWLRAKGAGFYTIGSSGHEGNAGVAAALRLTDPALLHYRSGAFYLARSAQASPPHDGVNDVLLGLVAAAAEPIAGGRHKVFGHPQLNVIPQTSTIASHLPRAWAWPSRCPGRPSSGCPALAAGRDRGVQLRRRVGQPLDRGRRDQHRRVLHLPGPAAAAAAGLRGQRPWHQRADPGGLDRGPARRRRAEVLPGRRRRTWPGSTTRRSTQRPGRGTGGGPRSCTCPWCGTAGTRARTWSRATAAPPRSPPTWPGPAVGTARLLVACGALTPSEVAGPVRGQRGADHGAGRRGDQRAPAVLGRAGDGAAGAAAALGGGGQRGPARAAVGPRPRVHQPAPGGRRAADPGPDHQRHAGRRPGRPARRCWCSARTWPARAACTG